MEEIDDFDPSGDGYMALAGEDAGKLVPGNETFIVIDKDSNIVFKRNV